MFRSRFVSMVLVVLFIWQTGCTYYSQVEIGDLPQRGKVRVTLSDGERQSVYDPWMDGDDLRGWRTKAGNGEAELSSDGDIIFKLDSVSSIETRHTSMGKTVGLVLLMVVAATAGIAYASLESMDCCL